jgi:hypothetical protein
VFRARQIAHCHVNLGVGNSDQPGIGSSYQPIPRLCCLLAVAAERAVGQAGGGAVRAELQRASRAVVALTEVVAAVALLAQNWAVTSSLALPRVGVTLAPGGAGDFIPGG